MEIGATVTATFLRGRLVFEDGAVVGEPSGRYLHRPPTR
jgi:allantoinase